MLKYVVGVQRLVVMARRRDTQLCFCYIHRDSFSFHLATWKPEKKTGMSIHLPSLIFTLGILLEANVAPG